MGAARHDMPLILGALVALLLTFLDPLARLFGAPESPAARFAVAALPGFLLMAGLLALDRRKARATADEADARVDVLISESSGADAQRERGLAFVRALAKVVDADGVTSAIADHLAAMAGTPRISVLLTAPTGWEIFAGERGAADELIARAGTEAALTNEASELTLPLRAQGEMLGVLVVGRAQHDVAADTLRVLDTAAAALAIVVRNLQLQRDARDTNLRDVLTGCASRPHGVDVIDGELRRARRSLSPVSLVFIDVDHLKDINSRYGYPCGDAVLALIGRRLRDLLRRSDLKCRYGGEEFVLLLPETALIGARRVAETLRREIADRPMPWNGGEITVTASFGVTQALPGEVSVGAVIARAEAAAHRAQSEGHNTVRVASDSLVSLDKGRRGE